mmetsp:Transcript_43222/g.94194  ORF Transcript_43222/g.94194 Transcript_43222/m.94194 type:complete len:289 (-) Transcript_43222:97-963(-)|eukprot:CAMPEP_0170611500 /NCGR_PEP_ID=MMETSP0224-20130122/23221_1 /TAXON_ID=285029 /ORGANISM="Togula jolla, Strain CCCM 725" /LENGTH=288 /DNA_ID=CAMNT_0010936937 /DNA_START=56 /DNA_END=922 /DNA_ORIENTATION=+
MHAAFFLFVLSLPSSTAALEKHRALLPATLLRASTLEEDSLSSDLFMRYMPKHRLAVCACAKCGSTSLWNYLYENEFGTPWQWSDEPYVQHVTSDRWQGRFVQVRDPAEQERIMDQEFSFALIRDPKERLVSAWKSKFACGDSTRFHTDLETRDSYVNALLTLAGWKTHVHCLSLDAFTFVLEKVHSLGRAQSLDRHVLPQHLGCFKDFPPHRFSRVTRIDEDGAFLPLALRLNTTQAMPRHLHVSTDGVLVTEKIEARLEQITSEEYAMLGEFLGKESSAKEEASVL